MLVLLGVVPLLALAACANPELPAEPTPAEVRQVVLDLETEQWFTMFGEKREPQTLVRVWVDSFAEQKAAVDECMAATTAPDRDLVQWLCFKRYPVSPDSPDLDFILTKAQADYLYDYYVERLNPCLESLGLTVGEAPRRVEFTRVPYGALSWSPYVDMSPQPDDDAGWQWVISQCGTPPYADRTHPMPNDIARLPDPAQTELQAKVTEEAALAWERRWPDDPMPVVEPVHAVADLEAQWSATLGCLQAMHIPGLEIRPDSGGIVFADSAVFTNDQVLQAQWICRQQYPVVPYPFAP